MKVEDRMLAALTKAKGKIDTLSLAEEIGAHPSAVLREGKALASRGLVAREKAPVAGKSGTRILWWRTSTAVQPKGSPEMNRVRYGAWV
ncbi:hypothetical protein [Porticoccus sp.]